MATNTTKEIYEVHVRKIEEDLVEWTGLITELSDKERKLFSLRDKYQAKSEEIIETTDFKAIYGRNNAETRKNHIRQELSSDYNNIKELEFHIDWINRRIIFLKELIRTKRTLLEVKE